MSRNYGWGQRDMQAAGRIALQASGVGFSSVATHASRFGKFKDFAKANGVGRMEKITFELVQNYGRGVADRVDAREISPAYGQNLISSVNSVMRAATRGEWKSVSPTKECAIEKRSNVRVAPTVERSKSQGAIDEMRGNGKEREAAIASLAQDLGMRSKEASLLNAKVALNQARTKGVVSVSDGTKGGRVRDVPITNERQIQTLELAAAAQGDARAVMPADQNWKSFREGDLRETRETMQTATGGGLHDLRACYAAERYEALVGHPAPCNGGKIEDRRADIEARKQIAAELGHGRVDVVSSYLGGR